LPAFGAGAACCAKAADAADIAAIATKAKCLPNRRFVMSYTSVCDR
jgi:hypothetical protein